MAAWNALRSPQRFFQLRDAPQGNFVLLALGHYQPSGNTRFGSTGIARRDEVVDRRSDLVSQDKELGHGRVRGNSSRRRRPRPGAHSREEANPSKIRVLFVIQRGWKFGREHP